MSHHARWSLYSLLSQLPLGAVLAELKSLNIQLWNLAPAIILAMRTARSMLEEAAARAEFQRVIADHRATIAALTCHGNALHPDRARAQQNREVSPKTIVLAERLGIPVFL